MGIYIQQAILITIILLFPMWRIFKRAGLNPFSSFTLLIPILGLRVAGLILALSNWQQSTKIEDVE